MSKQIDDGNVIGEFQPWTYRITCEREPEVGIAWMACVTELGRCALGKTPKEAGETLLRTLGIGGRGMLYEDNCESLEKTGSTWQDR